MPNIFEITDKTGRRIILTDSLHPYMANYLEEIKRTLEKPDIMVTQKYSDARVNYYRFLKDRKKYLLVAVKYLNGEGFVNTSFITSKIKKRWKDKN